MVRQLPRPRRPGRTARAFTWGLWTAVALGLAATMAREWSARRPLPTWHMVWPDRCLKAWWWAGDLLIIRRTDGEFVQCSPPDWQPSQLQSESFRAFVDHPLVDDNRLTEYRFAFPADGTVWWYGPLTGRYHGWEGVVHLADSTVDVAPLKADVGELGGSAVAPHTVAEVTYSNYTARADSIRGLAFSTVRVHTQGRGRWQPETVCQDTRAPITCLSLSADGTRLAWLRPCALTITNLRTVRSTVWCREMMFGANLAPDGTQAVVSCMRDGGVALFLLGGPNHEPRPLTAAHSIISSTTYVEGEWSPSGAWILARHGSTAEWDRGWNEIAVLDVSTLR